jgi:hypothetical protein
MNNGNISFSHPRPAPIEIERCSHRFHQAIPSKCSITPEQTPMPSPQTKKSPEVRVQPMADYAVIVGRGKEAKKAIGNRRLTVLAKTVLPDYIEAKNKIEKTKIVTSLMAMVHGAGGFFVRVVEGGVEEVDEHAARVKIGSVLRNLLHDRYLSSSKSRVKKRQVQRHTGVIESLEPRPIGKDGTFQNNCGDGTVSQETPASILSLFEFLNFTFDDLQGTDEDDFESIKSEFH